MASRVLRVSTLLGSAMKVGATRSPLQVSNYQQIARVFITVRTTHVERPTHLSWQVVSSNSSDWKTAAMWHTTMFNDGRTRDAGTRRCEVGAWGTFVARINIDFVLTAHP